MNAGPDAKEGRRDLFDQNGQTVMILIIGEFTCAWAAHW